MSNKLRSYVVKTTVFFSIDMVLLSLVVGDGVSDLKIIVFSFVIANFLYVLQVSLLKMKFLIKTQLLVIDGRDKLFRNREVKDSIFDNNFFNDNNHNAGYQYLDNPNLFDSNMYLINPASGLPMIDNSLDVNGNMYGTNNSE